MKKNVFTFLLLFSIFIIFVIYKVLTHEINNQSIFVITTFIIIIAFSLYNLFIKDRYSYSLNKVFWIFNLIFLGLIPFFQYIYNIRPWISLVKLDINTTYTYSNIFIIIWFLTYTFFYKIKHKEVVSKQLDIGITTIGYYLAFLIGITSAIILGTLDNGDNIEDVTKSSRLIFYSFLRTLSVFSYVILIVYKRENISIIFSFILLYFIFMYVIPLGGNRYFFATVIIGITLTHKRIIKNKNIFSYTLIFAVLVIFPLLGFLRYFHSLKEILDNYHIIFQKSFADAYFGGNFDAYTMILNTIQYTYDFGYSYGYQLLGAILFFIPRSFWIDKPIGSGATIADGYNYFFTNLSEPLIAESYINFGIIGVILFALFISRFISIFDKQYWYYLNNKIINYNILIYPFTLGFFFFMQRGDLLSSYSFLFGFLFTSYFYYKLFKIFFIKQTSQGEKNEKIY